MRPCGNRWHPSVVSQSVACAGRRGLVTSKSRPFSALYHTARTFVSKRATAAIARFLLPLSLSVHAAFPSHPIRLVTAAPRPTYHSLPQLAVPKRIFTRHCHKNFSQVSSRCYIDRTLNAVLFSLFIKNLLRCATLRFSSKL